MKTRLPAFAAILSILTPLHSAVAQSQLPTFVPVAGLEIAPDVASKACSCKALNLTLSAFVPGHPDPVCAATFTADDCARALALCDCVPDNAIQIAGIRSSAPTAITDPKIGALTALAGQVSRAAVSGVVVISNKSGTILNVIGVPLFSNNQTANQGSGAVRMKAALSTIAGTENILSFMLRFAPPLNGINDAIQISSKGDKVFVQGPIKCPAGERVSELWVTVTQPDTGAMGRDRWRGTCTGEVQTWKLKVPTSRVGKARFAPGSAHVCAAAVFELNGTPRTADQWCNDVELFQ